MIKVLIPSDSDFNYNQCKILYENIQELLQDYQKFDEVINNTFFYSFLQDDKHIGCIYYYEQDNKLYVNGFSYRKTHILNIECLKKSLDWWNCDIFARIYNKSAIFTLLKCGFKKVDKNLYKYERRIKNGRRL